MDAEGLPIGPAEDQASVALVSVHYRDDASARELIQSIAGWTRRPISVCIADNSGELLRDAPSQADVVGTGQNLGYAAAINLAYRHLSSSTPPAWLLICTQDARLQNDALEEMLHVATAFDDIDVCAPVLTYRSDPDRIFSTGGTLLPDGRTTHEGRGLDARTISVAPRSFHSVDWADGAALLVRAEAFERLGGLPEEYFLYVEEVDFQYRVRRSGRRVVVVDSARGSQEPGDYKQYLQFRNNIHFTRKYSRDFKRWPWLEHLARGIYQRLRRGKPFSVRGAARGIFDGSTGRMGSPRARGSGS